MSSCPLQQVTISVERKPQANLFAIETVDGGHETTTRQVQSSRVPLGAERRPTALVLYDVVVGSKFPSVSHAYTKLVGYLVVLATARMQGHYHPCERTHATPRRTRLIISSLPINIENGNKLDRELQSPVIDPSGIKRHVCQVQSPKV